MTHWAISILAATFSCLVFALIDSKVKYVEKLSIKIKSRTLRIALFILGAVLLGVLSAAVRMVTLDIFGNELLAEITQWIIFGAFLPFVLGGISSKRN